MNKKQTPQAKIARKKLEKFTIKDIHGSEKVFRVLDPGIPSPPTCCCCCTAVALSKPIK